MCLSSFRMKKLENSEYKLIQYTKECELATANLAIRREKLIDYLLEFEDALKHLKSKLTREMYTEKLILANESRLVLNHLFRMTNFP